MNPIILPNMPHKTQVEFKDNNISNDAGLSLIFSFFNTIHFKELIQKFLPDREDAKSTYIPKVDKMLFLIFMSIAGYKHDVAANSLKDDKIFKEVGDLFETCNQSTLSKFWNSLDESDYQAFEDINKAIIQMVNDLEVEPPSVILDADSTLIATYGHQEGGKRCFHYNEHGYHPLLVIDDSNGCITGFMNRNGNAYTGKSSDELLKELFGSNITTENCIVRGDSGFSDPDIMELCEKLNVGYVLKMTKYVRLQKIVTEYYETHGKKNLFSIGYATKTTWSHKRRVVCEISGVDPKTGKLNMECIVTNLKLSNQEVMDLYNGRGNMENGIKEFKTGFGGSVAPSKLFMTNSCRMMISIIAFNLMILFKKMILKGQPNYTIETLRFHLFHIGGKIIKHAGKLTVQISSCYVDQDLFEYALANLTKMAC